MCVPDLSPHRATTMLQVTFATLIVVGALRRLGSPQACAQAQAPISKQNGAAQALSAAAKTGEYSTALTLLEELCSAAKEENRWPHPRCFDDAIVACARGAPPQWQQALEVLARMRSFGLEPRAHAFNAAISACSRAGEWEQSMTLLDQMKAVGVAPSVISYNAALDGARVAGQPALALQLLQSMRDRGLAPDAISYACAISACQRRGSDAVSLVDSAVAENITLSEPSLASVLVAVSSREKGKGHREHAATDADRVWSLLLQQQDGGKMLGVRAYNARLLERGTALDWRGALELLETMRSEGAIDGRSCGYAMRACGRAGAWEAALDLLARVETDFGEPPGERLHCWAIQACAKAGQTQEAIRLFDEAELGLGLSSPKLYGAAMNAVRTDYKQCLELLERMRTAGVDGDVGIYGSALHACQMAREWQHVYDLLYRMREEKVISLDSLSPFHRTLFKRARKEIEK